MKVPLYQQIKAPFERWLSLPNYDVVEVVAAAVLANRLPGEPLWLALVGPSSSGKTEVVRALSGLRRTHMVDHFTKATFASGYARTPKDNNVYGLLTEMMDNQPHIVIVTDFSVVINKAWDDRCEIMNQLRKLYDGEWKTAFGNEKNIHWRGKCGMIVCSTGTYDREMGAQTAFGDRFLVCRQIPGDPLQVAELAGRNATEIKKMRLELKRAMRKVDTFRIPKKEIHIDLDVRTYLAKLSAFVSIARTSVPRDPKTKEILAIPEIEGTGRLSSELHQLLRGLLLLRETKIASEDEVSLVERVALGTIPSLRMKIIEKIHPRNGDTAQNLIELTDIPRSVLYRTLEDLKRVGLLHWEAQERPANPRRGRWIPESVWKPLFWRARLSGYEL